MFIDVLGNNHDIMVRRILEQVFDDGKIPSKKYLYIL